jgi:hypothetical protein
VPGASELRYLLSNRDFFSGLGDGVNAERADAWRNQLIRTLNGGGDYEVLGFCFAVQRLARQSI